MNILVLTAYTENLTSFARITADNIRQYAQKNGYDYIVETKDFYKDMHPVWSKIKFIKKHLSNYDYIFWVDIDVLIMRFDIKLEFFLNDNLEYDLIFNREEWWNNTDYVRFNAGVFFIKNTQFSLDFLNKLLTLHGHDVGYEEQGAMWIMYNENIMNSNEKIKILPWDTFNSIYNEEELIYYKNDRFICHFAAMKNEHRLKAIEECLNYVVC